MEEYAVAEAAVFWVVLEVLLRFVRGKFTLLEDNSIVGSPRRTELALADDEMPISSASRAAAALAAATSSLLELGVERRGPDSAGGYEPVFLYSL